MQDLELSLLNSLKVLFSGLGAKNSDNNYAVPLFSKSDATPAGFMNLSDLASVLGVMKNVAACNIDTELNRKQYYIGQANSLSGTMPALFGGGARTKCIVICYSKESDQYASGYQEFYCYNRQEGGPVSRRYYRTYNGSTQTWNDWQRIYDAGMLNDSYDLSPLANALGSSGYLQQAGVAADEVIDLGEKVYYIVITAISSSIMPAVIASNGTNFVTLSTETHIQVAGEEPASSAVALWWVYFENGHVKVKNKRNTGSTLNVYYAFSSR